MKSNWKEEIAAISRERVADAGKLQKLKADRLYGKINHDCET